MRINVRNVIGRGVGRTRRAAGGGSTDFAKHLEAPDEGRTAPTSGPSSLGSLEALLALQERNEGGSEREGQELRRGHSLLDELEAIRQGLLLGCFRRDRLEALANSLDGRSEQGLSPQLTVLLREIELRVKVELAKLSVI